MYVHYYMLILNIASPQLSMLVKNDFPHSSGPLLLPAGNRYAQSTFSGFIPVVSVLKPVSFSNLPSQSISPQFLPSLMAFS